MLNINTIKAEMARLNITQKDLAKKLNISTSTISMKMTERLDFTLKELIILLELFNLSFEEIICGSKNFKTHVS